MMNKTIRIPKEDMEHFNHDKNVVGVTQMDFAKVEKPGKYPVYPIISDIRVALITEIDNFVTAHYDEESGDLKQIEVTDKLSHDVLVRFKDGTQTWGVITTITNQGGFLLETEDDSDVSCNLKDLSIDDLYQIYFDLNR